VRSATEIKLDFATMLHLKRAFTGGAMTFFNLIFLLQLGHTQSPMIFKGLDTQTRQPCYLKIIEQTSQPYTALVQTSYFHGNQQSPVITVQYPTGNRDRLMGTDQTQTSQIAVFLKNTAPHQQLPDYFNLKWKHGNHFHNESCRNLVHSDN